MKFHSKVVITGPEGESCTISPLDSPRNDFELGMLDYYTGNVLKVGLANP